MIISYTKNRASLLCILYWKNTQEAHLVGSNIDFMPKNKESNSLAYLAAQLGYYHELTFYLKNY